MSWTDRAFEALAQLLVARTGLAFAPARRAGAELAIRRAMEHAGVGDPGRYLERVRREPILLNDLVDELTVGETYFFREPAQYRFIRDTILPEILDRRGRAHPIRAWSAGCASGEEAYSLAMLFAGEGLSGSAHVLATDISRAALEKARQGSYSAWSLRGDGASAALHYLVRDGDRYVVADAIRRLVTVESLNLAFDLYPSLATGTRGMDLILCRNVLIYFDRATVRTVAGRLHEALAQGGWLIAASSDPSLLEWAPFEAVMTDAGLFYRRRAAAVDPPSAADRGADPVRPASALPVPSALPTPGRVGAVSEGEAAAEALAAAREDLARGDYERAAGRTEGLSDDPEAVALRVRALANLDVGRAERACAEAAARHPLSTELHYLRALLLLGLGREGEAARAARRAIYLDRSTPLPHFLLGSILLRHGDRKGAWRCFRNARDLCSARPGREVVPFSDGEPAGRLAEAASEHMQRIDGDAEGAP